MKPVCLVQLSGEKEGETAWLQRVPSTIGSDPGCNVVVPGAAPRHASIVRNGDDLVIQDGGSEGGTLVDGVRVQQAVLHDGGVLELGAGGPRLRFHDLAPVRVGIDNAQQPRDRMSESAVHRIVHEKHRPFRWTVAALLAVAAGTLGWSYYESRRLQRELAGLQGALRHAEAERQALAARVEGERARNEEQRLQLAHAREHEEQLNLQMADAAATEIEALRTELGTTRERIKTLESERAAGENIIRQYGAGVCLLYGSYTFEDDAGRPLHTHLDESGKLEKGEGGERKLAVDENGPVYEVEFFGTGFLIDSKGSIVTNRHVAEPWWKDKDDQKIIARGFQPRMTSFRAFFPRQNEGIDVKAEKSAASVDLALLRADVRRRGIPVLPLDRTMSGAVPGQPVVVVGYPSALEALLAKAETSVVRQILDAHGTSRAEIAEALGGRGLIRPATTQGHISDVTPSDIVFDAQTTQGGSGGPVFNKYGKVIAVEYAVLQRFGGNSFGLPIAHVFELLRKTPARTAAAGEGG